MADIISIQALQRGIGKSNLTANVAVAIAQQGYRVGIVDTGIQPTGTHALFNLDDEKTDHLLNYYLWNDNIDLELDLKNSPILKIGDGELVVMGGSLYLAPANIKVKEITSFLQQGQDVGLIGQGFSEVIQRLELDYLLIDSRPELNEESLLLIAISNLLLLVLSLEQRVFQNIAVTLDVARKLGTAEIALIANLVLPEFDLQEVEQELTRSYCEAVVGVLPFSEEMLQLASRDIFYLRYPNHALTQRIQAIAQYLISHTSQGERSTPIVTAQVQASPTTTSPAPSLFDVLALPKPQRQIVSFVTNHGTVSLQDITSDLNQTADEVAANVATLLEQGFLKVVAETGQIRYCSYLCGSVSFPQAASPSSSDASEA